jgi:hypothetical protein
MNLFTSTLRPSFVCIAALSASLIACGLQADLPRAQADAGGVPVAPDAGGQPVAPDAGSSAPVDMSPVPDAEIYSDAVVYLPTADPCRNVLASFAMAMGTAYGGAAPTATVSLVEANVYRVYVVDVSVNQVAHQTYALTLSNDGSSKCAFEALKVNADTPLVADARARATTRELVLLPQISTSEASDKCAAAVGYLTQGLAQSMVALDQAGTNATWKRGPKNGDYAMRVNGKDFTANGLLFPNDYGFTAFLSKDCIIFDVQYVPL